MKRHVLAALAMLLLGFIFDAHYLSWIAFGLLIGIYMTRALLARVLAEIDPLRLRMLLDEAEWERRQLSLRRWYNEHH